MSIFGWPSTMDSNEVCRKGLTFPDKNSESRWWEHKQHKLKTRNNNKNKGTEIVLKIKEESHLLKWLNNTTKRAVPSRGQPRRLSRMREKEKERERWTTCQRKIKARKAREVT